MTTMIEVRVPAGSPAVAKVVAALEAMGGVAVRRAQAGGEVIEARVPGATCVVCRKAYSRLELEERPALGGLACLVCRQTARKIWQQLLSDWRRQCDEARGQLAQMVRDYAANGGEMPHFYRGFE